MDKQVSKKRAAEESDEDIDALFEDEDPAEIIKEKQLAKKKKVAVDSAKKKKTTALNKKTSAADNDDDKPSSSTGISKIAFDEVLQFKEDPAEKFDKIYRLSTDTGVGICSNSVALFKIYTKNKEEQISSYQFNVKNNVIPNLIEGLRKVLKLKMKK